MYIERNQGQSRYRDQYQAIPQKNSSFQLHMQRVKEINALKKVHYLPKSDDIGTILQQSKARNHEFFSTGKKDCKAFSATYQHST